MTPLLFAAWERFSAAEFTRVLKLVATLSFRYSVVSGLNTNTLEPAYHRAAKAVLQGAANTAADVFERLRPVYVEDTKFEQDFAGLTVDGTGQRKKLAKYILSRLEQEVSGRAVDPDTDPATIEHILPESPSEGWEASFPVDRWEAATNRLGNLTLLEPAANRQLGNAEFSAKLAAYQGSAYLLTRQIAELAPEEWTPALLDVRQQRLARRAVHLWRADFV